MKKDLKVHNDNIVMRRASNLKKGDCVLNLGEVEEALFIFEANEKTHVRLTFRDYRIFVSESKFLFVEIDTQSLAAELPSIHNSPLQPRERATAIRGVAID